MKIKTFLKISFGLFASFITFLNYRLSLDIAKIIGPLGGFLSFLLIESYILGMTYLSYRVLKRKHKVEEEL